MKDLIGEGIPVAKVWGIDVRVHIVFVLWIGLTTIESSDPGGLLFFNAILFGSVLLHEFGHCFGARSVGGDAHRVLLWPLGGLASIQHPNTAWAEFVSTAAGPAVNLLLAAVAFALYLLIPEVDPTLAMPTLIDGTLRVGLFSLLWVNILLFVFNVLPAFPMDGGKIFRSALWPIFGWRTATLVATVLGMLMGGLFTVGGFLIGELFLAFIGFFVVMASWGEFDRARKLPPPSAYRVDDDLMPHERHRR